MYVMTNLRQLRQQIRDCYKIQKENDDKLSKLELELFRRTREIFDQIDTNQSGKISVWEFLVYSMRETDPSLSDEALKSRSELKLKRFRSVDKNKDELLDFSEVFSFQKTLIDN